MHKRHAAHPFVADLLFVAKEDGLGNDTPRGRVVTREGHFVGLAEWSRFDILNSEVESAVQVVGPGGFVPIPRSGLAYLPNLPLPFPAMSNSLESRGLVLWAIRRQ